MSRREKVVVIGAGGHAKVVLELLIASGYEPAALLDRDETPRQVLGVPVIGGDARAETLRAEGLARAFVALGHNGARAFRAEALERLGFELVTVIHPSAQISPSARIGAGAAVMAGALVNAESVIGDLAILNTGSVVDHDGRIGRAAHLAPGAVLAGGVSVGDEAFVGAGAVVIPGLSIGARSVVGAGSTVVRDVPPDVTVVGSPARRLGGEAQEALGS